MRSTPRWIFAYASLAATDGATRPHRLLGHRRRWQVAMDNRVDIPGYKCYLDPASGERPAVYVTFLDLAEAPGAAVNGVLLPVDAAVLAALDRRERNYHRVDVTRLIDPPAPGRVDTYLGSAQGRQRHARGQRSGTAVVDRAYHDRVLDAFARHGRGVLAEFLASTDPPPCPLRPLHRVEIA